MHSIRYSNRCCHNCTKRYGNRHSPIGYMTIDIVFLLELKLIFVNHGIISNIKWVLYKPTCILYYFIFHYIVLYYITLCYVILYYIVLYYIMLLYYNVILDILHYVSSIYYKQLKQNTQYVVLYVRSLLLSWIIYLTRHKTKLLFVPLTQSSQRVICNPCFHSTNLPCCVSTAESHDTGVCLGPLEIRRLTLLILMQ